MAEVSAQQMQSIVELAIRWGRTSGSGKNYAVWLSADTAMNEALEDLYGDDWPAKFRKTEGVAG